MGKNYPSNIKDGSLPNVGGGGSKESRVVEVARATGRSPSCEALCSCFPLLTAR